MSQIQDYKLKLSLIKAIQTYQEAIDDLSKTVESLPRCPCCPPKFKNCVFSLLFISSEKAAKDFAKKVKINQKIILKAMSGEHTFTTEEVEKIKNWI